MVAQDSADNSSYTLGGATQRQKTCTFLNSMANSTSIVVSANKSQHKEILVETHCNIIFSFPVIKKRIFLRLLLLLPVTSAFTNPASPMQQGLRIQCRPVQLMNPLHVQSKETNSVYAEDSDTTVENDEDKQRLLLARDFIQTPGKDTLGIEPAYTTCNKAASPVTKPPVAFAEGADIAAEEGFASDALLWRGVIVLLCALWASNFACAKIVLAQDGVDASLYAVARFSIAFLSLVPGSLDATRKGSISLDTARGAFLCGLWVAGGYLGQIIGLLSTTPSRSCVICSLNCIFVAIVAEWIRVRATIERGYDTSFELKKLIPALIAVTGVAIVELKGAAGDPTIGDLISFAQPVGFGMGYLQLEELMKKQPSAAMPVSAIKLAVVSSSALFYYESARGGEGAIPDFSPLLTSPVALSCLAYTGLVTTSAALYVESIAFARVRATDASIILTTEPLFAAAVSSFLIGEKFGAADALGAFFIIGACIYSIRMGESEEICEEETKKCVVEEL